MQERIFRNVLALCTTTLLLAGVFVGGCASPNLQKEMPKPKEISKPLVKTINYKPDWLLIGGVDISADKVVADRITTPRLFGILDFDITGDPEITFSFYYGPKIIYWSGKGEITNTKTGERVFVPLAK